MSTHVSRGKIFYVSVEVDDERLKQFKKAPELMQDALQKGAFYYHTGIFPRHFEAGAAGRYGFAPRSQAYLKKKGGGKPDLVNSGRMKADLLARAALRSSGKMVTLQLTSRVLNLCPNMPETSTDLYVKHNNKSANGYPNLKRELRQVTDDERELIATAVTFDLEKNFGPT